MKHHQIKPSNTDRLWHGALFVVAFFFVWIICLSIASVSIRAILQFVAYEASSRGVIDVCTIAVSTLLAAIFLRSYWKPEPREVCLED